MARFCIPLTAARYADRPIQSSALGLFSTGLLLIALGSTFRGLFVSYERIPGHAAIPLKELCKPYGSRESSPVPTRDSDGLSFKVQCLAFFATAVIICLRVEVFRRILKDRQCTIPGVEVRTYSKRTQISAQVSYRALSRLSYRSMAIGTIDQGKGRMKTYMALGMS